MVNTKPAICKRCKKEWQAPEPIECFGVSIVQVVCWECGKEEAAKRAEQEFRERLIASSLPQGLIKMSTQHRGDDMLVSWAVAKEHLLNNRTLWFSGPMGTGKSVTATTIAVSMLKKNHGVRYTTEAELIRAYSDKNNSDAYYRTCNTHIVLFDDLGVGKTAHMAINEFIDSRYRNGLPLIVTDNFGPDMLAEREGYDRIVSRLYGMSQPLGPCMFEGNDKRLNAGVKTT